ncbi:MOSC domain-containing protein [Reinekea marinisedimentorum]|uniref:MOSC domain-containing protein n=1 Tax=Reinekea marinisedimentorum TaxID=230495 RepID=A0A4R3I8J5_9GAMM|nr:MOSC N-terminal beta barrel domain-containing protein [Reinekea marinisedimentorum]TCS42444.1 hypothetical protein BCF53_103105 [Reinekea marinisedimentorum]
MSPIYIQQLFIYPIKSMGGVAVPAIEFTEFGPKNDRRYMLVDSKHRFLTQRSHPILAQFKLSAKDGGWVVKFDNRESPVIYPEQCSDDVFETKVWKTPIQVREKCQDISGWFSEQLDELVKLVEFDDLESRYQQIDGHKAPLAFADGYPLLICNSDSLTALSKRVNCNLSMRRFRPNVVVSMQANAEFIISSFTTDGGELLLGPPCVRCNIPAIDPETSVYQAELHKQMKAELLRDGRVVFGVNAAASHLKKLSVGDELTPVIG